MVFPGRCEWASIFAECFVPCEQLEICNVGKVCSHFSCNLQRTRILQPVFEGNHCIMWLVCGDRNMHTEIETEKDVPQLGIYRCTVRWNLYKTKV